MKVSCLEETKIISVDAKESNLIISAASSALAIKQ
jgi:hypothetical protein